MDFELTDGQKMIRETVRAFAEKKIKPVASMAPKTNAKPRARKPKAKREQEVEQAQSA